MKNSIDNQLVNDQVGAIRHEQLLVTNPETGQVLNVKPLFELIDEFAKMYDVKPEPRVLIRVLGSITKGINSDVATLPHEMVEANNHLWRLLELVLDLEKIN